MDKQEKISELFRIAREQEPKTSFEQTKDQFLSSLKNQTVKSNRDRMSNLKKWIIMLSSIIITTGLSLLFLNQKDNVESKRNSINNQFAKEVKNENLKQSNSTITSSLQHSEKKSAISKGNNSINSSSANNSFNLNYLFLNPLATKYQNIPFDDTLKLNEVVFPKFLEKEKKAIIKQKNLMLKMLAKTDSKKYAYFPSGNITIAGQTISLQSFFMQTTEVTNLEYRTFLYDLLLKGKKEEYIAALPDEKMWVKVFTENQKNMAKDYFTHPSYDDYPVVNISSTGVEMYCEWLLKEVELKYPDKDFSKIKPRIPVREEWIYAASSCGKNMIYPWETDSTKNEHGCYLCNYKPFPNSFFEDGGFYTVKVDSYNPNPFGLYNMSGNAAELVYDLDRSQSKPWEHKTLSTAGGGWMDNAETIKIVPKDTPVKITEPHPNVGFRVVFTHLGR